MNALNNVSGLPALNHITSVYWAFFSGGARKLHTDIVGLLNEMGIKQHVINFYTSVDRGGKEGVQYQENALDYKRLTEWGINLDSLGLTHKDKKDKIDLNRNIETFSGDEDPKDRLETIVRDLADGLDDTQVILTVKEQPINLIVLANRYREEVLGKEAKPIIITLHRSDPGEQDEETFRILKGIEHDPKRKRYIAGYICAGQGAVVRAYHKALDLPESELDRFISVPNGMDRDIYKPRSHAEKEALLNELFPHDFNKLRPTIDEPIVLLNARNNPKEKNIGLFLESALLFLRDPDNDNAHVITCGSGMDEDGLGEMIGAAAKVIDMSPAKLEEVKERLHMLGKVSPDQMATLCSISNISTLTSPAVGEADPLVIREGLCGRAIPVCTSAGDTPFTVGIPNPEEQLLQSVEGRPYIFGERGILTSENAEDIAGAWKFAISHGKLFEANIEAYQQELDGKQMGERCVAAISQLLACYQAHQTGSPATGLAITSAEAQAVRQR